MANTKQKKKSKKAGRNKLARDTVREIAANTTRATGLLNIFAGIRMI